MGCMAIEMELPHVGAQNTKQAGRDREPELLWILMPRHQTLKWMGMGMGNGHTELGLWTHGAVN